jgi:hypothetical protein
MNKKFFTIGMAVLLGVSLSFFGCDDSTEEESPSTDAGLVTVLSQSITAGSEAGTKEAPKTASITLAAAAAAGAVKAADIVPATGATAKLFSDAAFETEADADAGIALPVGGTTDVYILVTAEDEATKLHYKVSIALPQDVIATVKPSAVDDTTTTGLTVAFAGKVGSTVTIKLAGTNIDGNGDLPSAIADSFANIEDSDAYPRVAAITLVGILNDGDTNFTIQQTNPAFIAYVLKDSSISDAGSTNHGTTPKTQAEIDAEFATSQTKYIFWQTVNPVTYNKIKQYAAVANAQDDSSGGFGILLMPTTNAADQTVTIIKKVSGDTTTFVIDYTEVTFAAVS